MGTRRTIKLATDIAMGIVLVALMATALIEEAPHEWLGIGLFVLVFAHIALNRRYLAALPKMRMEPLRILQLMVGAGLTLCLVGQIASSLVISKHAFGFLPQIPGAAWARRTHMLCSYWMFVLAFAHAGLHARFPKLASQGLTWTLRLVVLAISLFGVWSFVSLGLLGYLTGQVAFAFVDTTTPVFVLGLRYASVAVLVAAIFHYVAQGLMAIKKGAAPVDRSRKERLK